jgi:acyl carrier protein
LPLTPSKKIDYNLLPKPDLLSSNIESEYIAPKTETEIIISKIGMELLGIERMGIHDNFFELGGHSLLATQFISRIKEALKKDISLKLLFENPSINQLVSKIELIEEDMKDEEIIKQDRGEENFLDLLNEIDGMTDEEAKALLENEDGGLS